MTHRQIIKKWLAGLSLENCKVVDLGSGSKPAFRYIKNQHCFFHTIDNAKGIPEDRKGDIHSDEDICIAAPLENDYDVAFCLEVLEHVERPEQLILNIRRYLRGNGSLYLSAPFKYDVHSEKDYWRFTKQGLCLLLERNNFKINSIEETINELGFMVEAVAV